MRPAAILAVAACVLVLAAALIGADHALVYLAPTLILIALLALDRYPGESSYRRRLERPARARERRTAGSRPRPRMRAELPRGGALLAAGLAGRAPPLLTG